MKVKLIMLSSGSSTEYDVEVPVIIGRGRKAGLPIAHSLISRQHCELFESDGRLMIRDLGSLNGTLLNRRRLEEPSELSSGDTLFLGPVMFRVEFADACATKRHSSDETAIGDGLSTTGSEVPMEEVSTLRPDVNPFSQADRQNEDERDLPTSRSIEPMTPDPDPTDSPYGATPDRP